MDLGFWPLGLFADRYLNPLGRLGPKSGKESYNGELLPATMQHSNHVQAVCMQSSSRRLDVVVNDYITSSVQIFFLSSQCLFVVGQLKVVEENNSPITHGGGTAVIHQN